MTYFCSTIMKNGNPCPTATSKAFRKCGRHDEKCKAAVALNRKAKKELVQKKIREGFYRPGSPQRNQLSPMKLFLSKIDNPERDIFYDKDSEKVILFVNGVKVDSYKLDDVIKSMRILRSF